MANKYFPSKFTKAGTELPVLNLRGGAYIQVKDRIQWFREEHPTALIKTQLLEHQNEACIFKAEIYLPDSKSGQLVLVSTGHKSESKQGFTDYLEKAESGSVGRALLMLGYGTQMSNELDEGDRIVDAPVPTEEMSSLRKTEVVASTPTVATVARPSFRRKAEAAKTTVTNGSGASSGSTSSTDDL